MHKLPNSSVSKASQPPWMRILKSMRRRFGAPTTVLLWFSHLAWIALPPKQCSRGHNWKFSNNQDGAYCHLHCTAKLDEVYPVSDEEAEEEKAPVYKRCNYRKSWRDHGFFHFYLPCSLTPSKYLRALYWFLLRCASKADPERDRLESQGVGEDSECPSLSLVACHANTCWTCAARWADRSCCGDASSLTLLHKKEEEHWRVCWSYHAWSQDDRHGLFGAAAVYSQSHWCLRAD